MSDPRTITVTGEALVRVVPDHVVVTLGVESVERDLAKARVANDERARRVLDAARAHGVVDADLATDQVSIEPRRDDYTQPKPSAFAVQKTIVATLRDLGKFEGLIAACLDAGATHVHGVQFATGALRKHRDAARVAAVKAAREKAALLAKELGASVGPALRVAEGAGRWWSSWGFWGGRRGAPMQQNVLSAATAEAPEMGETTSPGTVNVSANVEVTFELDVRGGDR